jgi:hypothetical protein
VGGTQQYTAIHSNTAVHVMLLGTAIAGCGQAVLLYMLLKRRHAACKHAVLLFNMSRQCCMPWRPQCIAATFAVPGGTVACCSSQPDFLPPSSAFCSQCWYLCQQPQQLLSALLVMLVTVVVLCCRWPLLVALAEVAGTMPEQLFKVS